MLGASQTATVFPGWVNRAIVAVSIAQVIPLGFVAFWGNQKTAPAKQPGDVKPATTAS